MQNMKKLILCGLTLAAAWPVWAGDPALHLYNGNFAVVRDTVHLDLKPGVNEANYSGATMQLEPDSVVLRDPVGKRPLQILEQNFRADPISQALLLNYFVGKTIEFESLPNGANGKKEIVRGKIVRSGYLPRMVGRTGRGENDAEAGSQPIIEVDGKLMFRLPGEPLFPALPNDSILKPTLSWTLQTDEG